jgi:type I restriction enzyme, S subunit
MSFPKYERYKDSDVQWMDHVPAHWEIMPLQRITVDKCDGPFGSGLKSEHYTDKGVRVIRLQNIRNATFDESDAAFIDVQYYASLGGHDVRKGDLLIAGLGDDRNTVGRACVAPPHIEPAMVKADCFRFRLREKRASVGFVAAQLTAGSQFDAGMLSSGSTRSRIPLSTMAMRKVSLPPLPEQFAILDFLDRETAKIDSSVEEQHHLIVLLKEKRQAVISDAVTKGLDPNAPMKDSGVEWLGEVPEHWATSQSRRMFAVRSEPALEDDRMLTASQKYGVLYQADFVELEGRRVVEVIMGVDKLKHVEPNDFIISMRS